MGYRQLTQGQRYPVFAYLETGISQRQIAKNVGVHSRTISREIKRNGRARGYTHTGQTASGQRRRAALKVTKRLPSLIRWVTGQLMDEWSPQQISGFMANANGAYLSHQWIISRKTKVLKSRILRKLNAGENRVKLPDSYKQAFKIAGAVHIRRLNRRKP